jgi:uncharacterized protein (TIGR00299 family) protein
MIALELLGVEQVLCSSIPVGSGTVICSHGVMPVPAPATAELLKGVPIAATDEPGELTTPTAAAVLTTLAESFGTMPAMTVDRVGYGAGSRDGKTRPNVLRVLIGEVAEGNADADEIVVLETNLDDASPQIVAYALDRLLAEGALDVFATPIHMKKGRSGVLLSVLCEPAAAARLERLMMVETPTFGVRRHSARRCKLRRRHDVVETRFGAIRIKVGQGGGVSTASPEFDDCQAAAGRTGSPLREVIAEAQAAWRALHASGKNQR